MSIPKQMDPNQLAHVRRMSESNSCGLTTDQSEALLADRDFQEQRADDAEAEVARLRARVRVEASDVTDVTWPHVERWLETHGWVSWWQAHGKCYRLGEDSFGKVIIGQGSVDNAVRIIAKQTERPGLDILDEMARMEVP